ncbi:MAG: hypothetical protein ACTTHE_02035 [Prevotella multiformis]|uniref:hypothetical protein n=1 Tax=Prevotella multiformis TaxID=282402 RepID=UPI003FA0DF85
MTEKSTSQAEDGNPGWQALRKRQGKNRLQRSKPRQTQRSSPKNNPILQRSNNREEKGRKGKPQTSNLKSKGGGKPQRSNNREEKGERETSNLKPQISNQRYGEEKENEGCHAGRADQPDAQCAER